MAGAPSDMAESAVAIKNQSGPALIGGSNGMTDEHADAVAGECIGDAHRQRVANGHKAMTEATAQRLIAALHSHHVSLEETSRTLSEASRQLRDVCVLLNRRKHIL